MALKSRQTLLHYRLRAKIGEGGMGEVYRAEDSKLGREVALKVLPTEMTSDPQRLERFQREARAVAALNHPNIVTIYSVEEADGVHFLTIRHCSPMTQGPPTVPCVAVSRLFVGRRRDQ